MVGRMQNNRLVVQATGTSPVWGRLLERANVAAGFDLVRQADPYQPTDVTNFNQVGVASLAFFTGSHVDYHKPSDTAAKVNYDDLDRIVNMATATRPDGRGRGRARRCSPKWNSRPARQPSPASA